MFPLGTTYSGVVKRQSKVSHNTADSGRSVPDTSGSENATNVSAQTPQPSGGGAGLNHTASKDAAEGISLDRSSASGSSVVDGTPSVIDKKKVTEKENSDNESMDEEISPESPSASIKSSDKNAEAIENSMGKGGSLTLGFPTDFLQSSTPDVDKSAGGNASAFQEEINQQNTREETRGAIDALLRNLCPNRCCVDKYCRCTDVNTKGTTGSKNGFKDGVEPPGPASRRNKKGNKYK